MQARDVCDLPLLPNEGEVPAEHAAASGIGRMVVELPAIGHEAVAALARRGRIDADLPLAGDLGGRLRVGRMAKLGADERPIGTGGFFVALVPTGEDDMQACFDGNDWTSTLTVLDDEGSELSRAAFPFFIPARDTSGQPMQASGVMSPTSDEAAARILREEGLR